MSRKEEEKFQVRVVPKMWRGNDVPISPEDLKKGMRIPGATYDPRQNRIREIRWTKSPPESPEGDRCMKSGETCGDGREPMRDEPPVRSLWVRFFRMLTRTRVPPMSGKEEEKEFQIRVLPKMWHGNDVPISPDILKNGMRIPGAKYDPRQNRIRGIRWIKSPPESPEGDR